MECIASSSVTNSGASGRSLRVLLVDADSTSIQILKNLLESCSHEVTVVEGASIALSMVQERRCQYDIVLIDVDVPDMNAFALIKVIVHITTLPVILMSGNNELSIAKRALENGACFFLVKPISIEFIENMWQHVFQNKKAEIKQIEEAGSLEKEEPENSDLDNSDCSMINERNQNQRKSIRETLKEDEVEGRCDTNEGNLKPKKSRRKTDKEGEEGGHTTKKPRLIWDDNNLDLKFHDAMKQLDPKKATPKNIQELMNEPRITRKQIASHLQKYRARLQRVDASSPPHEPSLLKSFSIRTQTSKVGLMKSNVMTDFHDRTSFPQITEQHNPYAFQPGIAGNTQNHNAYPVYMFPIGSTKYLNQEASSINHVAALRCGQSLGNHHGNLNQVLSGTPSHKQPSDQNYSGFGMRPYHMRPHHIRIGSSSGYDISNSIGRGTDAALKIHPQSQARRGHFSCSPVDNFSMSGIQNHNNFTSIGNVGLFSRSNQLPHTEYTNNYTEVHRMSNGGLHGFTQTGATGESSNNISLDYHMLNEIMEENLDIGLEGSSLQIPELTCSSTNLNKFLEVLGEFTDVIQEPNDPVVVGSNQHMGDLDGSSNPIGRSVSENSLHPQQFDEFDFEEVFCEQPLDGAEIVNDFDINEYQIDEEGPLFLEGKT